MAKLTLADVGSLSNPSSATESINDNFTAIEEAIENTLSRDGSTPNNMEADLDMDGNTILNVADPVADTDAVNKRSVETIVNEYADQIIENTVFGTMVVETYVATAGQYEFILPSTPASINTVEVIVDGLDLTPTTDFTFTSTILSVATPLVGSEVVVIRYGAALPNGVSDATSVEFLATGEGAFARDVGARLDDVVCVLDYIPNAHHAAIRARTSTFDCSDAFQAAWTAMVTRGGSKLHVPAGLYHVGRASGWVIDYAGTLGSTYGSGFAIVGDGKGTTTIQLDTANGFLRWVHPGRNVMLTLRDFSVIAGINGDNGTAFHIESQVGGNHHHRDLIVENVELNSVALASTPDGYWTCGFYCKALWRPIFKHVAITGPTTGANMYAGDACIDAPECYGPEIHQSYLWGCGYGLRYISLEVTGGEGGKLIDTVLDNDIGAYVESVGIEPGFETQRVHTNCQTAGIWIKGRKLVTLTDSIVYNETSAAYSDIKLENCTDVTIENFTFFFGGNTSRIAVDVDADCERIFARDCKHIHDGTAYQLEAGADHIYIDRPYFSSDVDTQVDDLGATNLYVKQRVRQHSRVSITPVQSIPTGGNTTLAWTTEDIDVGGWGTVPSTTRVVPADRGIRRVRLTANVEWQNNSTGVRQLSFLKNGAVFAGQPVVDRNATGLSRTNIVSEIIDCVDGDTFAVRVFQDSGGALNIGANNGTWFAIEAVD